MANLHLVTGYAGKEHIMAADHGSFHIGIFGGGQYVLGNGNKLLASSPSNNIVRVLDGDILMQGRHIRLNEGNYVDLTIENGEQGYYRNDLIVARYTKSESTNVEEVNLVVIKGTAVNSDPADPEYTSGDLITDHDLLNDMPLYRVPLDGLAVQELVPLFTMLDINIPALLEAVNTLNSSKAPMSHNHSTDDIKSGVLPPERGGTGYNNIADFVASLGVTNIACGSYVGNDNCGLANPNTLAFSFEPKLVIIRADDASGKNGNCMGTTLVRGNTFTYNDTYGIYSSYMNVSWSGNSVSWYTNMGYPGDQLNKSGDTYYWVAIG